MSTGPSFQLAAVSYVLLGVTDLTRSVAFYRDKLGLSVAHEIPGFAFLNAGGLTLGLSAELARASECVVGATEIVFSVDDLPAAYQALTERGVAFFQPPRQVTAREWAANFVDPDGHRLSIFGPPAAS
jgi:predicted enzyme related to lactoylglutathione lyase